jgi:hypothetical protein
VKAASCCSSFSAASGPAFAGGVDDALASVGVVSTVVSAGSGEFSLMFEAGAAATDSKGVSVDESAVAGSTDGVFV